MRQNLNLLYFDLAPKGHVMTHPELNLQSKHGATVNLKILYIECTYAGQNYGQTDRHTEDPTDRGPLYATDLSLTLDHLSLSYMVFSGRTEPLFV